MIINKMCFYMVVPSVNTVYEVSAVAEFSDCQTEGPELSSRPGRGLNFARPSFTTLFVNRDVKTNETV